ncbi:translation elongation factor Ts [Aestuariirhabdus sp. Z084]|uniref:translation elongation factor Ts n=1 Tax=Aestuariirhabdus haliotis TaxID=2918751 RepID=UPI00201B3B75|nr:translation elongation factor Ts [Aestuariirhabdus haliotis]MCL6416384.1 translation elongation factor Ts [Aestuariirhabdus haliotis]MCL6420373.1 translation elongation factor Ts [Aestuariirhabdus haliotis]
MAAISASQVKELRDRTGLGMMECKRALTEAGGDIDKAIEEMRKSGQAKAAKKAGRTAAEGVVMVRLSDAGTSGVLVEVNSETDFAARDDNFLAFAGEVADAAMASGETDIAKLVEGGIETSRQALIQKIGENISPRRIGTIAGDVVGGYVHGNSRIAVLVALKGGDQELAKDVAMHVAAVNPRVLNKDDMPAEVVEKEKEIIKAQPDMEGKPAEIVEKMMVGRINKFLAENSLVEQPFVKNPELKVGKLVKDAGAEIISFVRFEVGEGIEKEEVDFAAEVAAQLKG